MTGRSPGRRLLSWGLAVVAVAFVAWIMPVRDRCWDPSAPGSTRVAVSRDASGSSDPAGAACVLHLRSGNVSIGAAECARLKCEPGVASTFAHARPGVLAALLLLYGLGTVAWAARWRALLGFAGIDLPLGVVWRISIEAQAGGILLPGGIGGDALRITSILARPDAVREPGSAERGTRAGAPIVVASVLLDRAVGLALIAGVAAAMGVASGGVEAGPLVAVLAAIPVGVFALLVFLRRAPIERVRWLSEGRLGRAVKPILVYVRDPRAPRAIAVAAALSVLVATTQFVVIRGLVFALAAEPSTEKWVYVGAAMAFIVSAVPMLPGGWGTADATYVFFFALAGLSGGIALGVCLLYRSFWYVSGLVGALLHMRGASDPGRGP